jgi:hypothetical protein
MFPLFNPALRAAEAALPMNTSHDALRNQLRKSLMAAHSVANTYDEQGPWIYDVFPEHVVYSFKGETYKRKYTATQGAAGTDPAITVGDAKKVHVAYVDSKESQKRAMSLLMAAPEGTVENWPWYEGLQKTIESVIITPAMFSEAISFIPGGVQQVQEAAEGQASIPICIITPGWGSSAYYSKEMIQQTGPQLFTKGTHMYMNHPTVTEDMERPERAEEDLSAVLTKRAYWDDNGPMGPGLYSDALVFSDHASTVLEKGPYTGCSVNVALEYEMGTIEGRTGKIAKSFVKSPLNSVDFVTRAGRGGAPIVPAMESATPTQGVENVTPEEIKAMQTENAALKTRVGAMEAQNNRILAGATVSGILREGGISVDSELLMLACQNPNLKEGKVDPEWARKTAETLARSTGSALTGQPTNLGTQPVPTKESQKQSDEEYAAALSVWGVSEAGQKVVMEALK